MFKQTITTKLLNKFDNQVDYIVNAGYISSKMSGKNVHTILKKLKKSAQKFLQANQLSEKRICDVGMMDATSDNSDLFLRHLYNVYLNLYLKGDEIINEDVFSPTYNDFIKDKLRIGDEYYYMIMTILISDLKENLNKGFKINKDIIQTYFNNFLYFDLNGYGYSKGIVNETLIHNETKEVVKINLTSTKPQDLNLALVYSLLILDKLEDDIKRN